MIQLIKEKFQNEMIEYNLNGTGELQLYILRPRVYPLKGEVENKKNRWYIPLNNQTHTPSGRSDSNDSASSEAEGSIVLPNSFISFLDSPFGRLA